MRILLLTITIISWGLWGFLSKLVVQKLHPLQMLIVGCCISFVLLPVYYWVSKTSSVSGTLTVSNVSLCVLASLMSTIGTIAYIVGIRTGELGSIAVISCSYPVLTVVLAALFLGEALTVSKIIGVILVIVGVIVLGR